ncbi:MAG TPA: C45 family peptidase [Candidatus Kryptonia bacterium]
MRPRSILFPLVVLLFSVKLFAQTGQLTQQQQSWISKAERHEKDGWIYLHIEGSPEERGFQHGYLLAKEIKESLRVLRARWEYLSAMKWNYYVDQAGRILTPKVDAENLHEIDGIVDGLTAAGDTVTENEMVAYNGYMELIDYWWPRVADSLRISSPPPQQQSCSSFIATGSMTADGNIVLGHNTMGGYEEPLCDVIIDIVPENGHRILMQTFPGFIHSGTDFFITDAGLVGSETTIGSFSGFDAGGVPEFSRMRHATQYANSIDEWSKMMEDGDNGGYANAWLLGDIKTNEIGRLELGLKYVGFEKKKDGYFVGSNVVFNKKILRFETTEQETNIKLSSVARNVRWHQLMKQYAGKIDAKLAEKFESDHFDTYLGKDQPDSRTLCGHSDLDARMNSSDTPFSPWGTLDGKVVDAKLAKKMSFIARWGSSCGTAFSAEKFISEHPQYDWMEGLMKERPSEPWTEFAAGEK